MPALSRRSFVTLTALASSSILLSPRAFAGSGATSAAGKPQETFLDFNESPYGPSAKARAAMQQAAALCGRYDYDAQDALVGLFAKQNGIPAESVHAYCGSRQPLQYAVAAFTGKERSLVMADPSYDSVLGAAQAQGAKVAAVPLDAEAAHDIERMLAAAQRDAGLIYICNPNNPTGTLTPHERIVRAIERKPERSVVLVDEAYIHFSDAPSVVGLAVQRQDVLVLRTFSKLYGMAGARLGLAIGHPQLLARLERFGGHNVVPSPTAHAGLESLRDDDLVPRRKQQNAEVRERTIAWLRQQASAAPPRSPTVSWWICAVPPSWSSPNWRNSGCTSAARGPPGPTGSA